MLNLRVLVDNNTLINRYYFAEPGAAYYLQTDGLKLLFDTGYSDIFLRNAEKMGVNLFEVDAVVISHGHNDHTGGLHTWIQQYGELLRHSPRPARPRLLAHPWAFQAHIGNGVEEGSLVKADSLSGFFNLSFCKEPQWLTPNLVFLGEIPRHIAFEAQSSMGKLIVDGQELDNYLLEDSALVYRDPQGLVIITGCSHAGICNIVQYAKTVFNEERIIDIIGGFHLLGAKTEMLTDTREFLRQCAPAAVHCCHCTDLAAKIALAEALPVKEVGVGLLLSYL